MKNKIFHYCLTTNGNLLSNFVFEETSDVEEWIEKELPKLEAKHGPLAYNVRTLPGLQIGDACQVYGEGEEIFRITGLIKYSPNRFGFSLDSGWTEEVAKCY